MTVCCHIAAPGTMTGSALHTVEVADMTYEQFRRQYEAYPWDSYHPLALILASGNRAYIDMPEQVTLTPAELVITRRAHPRQPERHRYADIVQLVPLLELPADPGGLSYAEFDPLIRRLLMADPFQPFVIELKNGMRIELDERGGTVRAGRAVSVQARSGNGRVKLTWDQITRITTSAKTAERG
jgi:hypothetical protein